MLSLSVKLGGIIRRPTGCLPEWAFVRPSWFAFLFGRSISKWSHLYLVINRMAKYKVHNSGLLILVIFLYPFKTWFVGNLWPTDVQCTITKTLACCVWSVYIFSFHVLAYHVTFACNTCIPWNALVPQALYFVRSDWLYFHPSVFLSVTVCINGSKLCFCLADPFQSRHTYTSDWCNISNANLICYFRYKLILFIYFFGHCFNRCSMNQYNLSCIGN